MAMSIEPPRCGFPESSMCLALQAATLTLAWVGLFARPAPIGAGVVGI